MQDNETIQFQTSSNDSAPQLPPKRIDDNPLDGDYGNYTFGQLQNDKAFNDAVDSKDSKAVYKMYHSFKQGLNRRLIDRASRGELTLDQLDGKVWNSLEYEKSYMKKAGLEKYEPLMENGNFTPPSLDNLDLRTLHGKLAPEFREIIRSKVSEAAAAKKPEAALGAYKDLLQYEDPETGKRESLFDAWSVNRWGEESDPDGKRMERWRKEAAKYGESRGIAPDEVLDQIADLVMKQEYEQGGDTRLSTDNGVSIGGGLYVNSGAVVIGSPTSVDETGAVLGMLNDSSLAKQAILKSSATDTQKLRGLRVLGAVRENLAHQLWEDTIIAGYGDNRSASEAILKNIATKGLYYFLAEEGDDFSRFEENYKPKWESKNGSVTRKLQKEYRTDLTIAFALERHENAGLWAGLEDNVFAKVDSDLVSGGLSMGMAGIDALERVQGITKKLYGIEGSSGIDTLRDNIRRSIIESQDSVEYVKAARQRIRKLDYGAAGNFIADVSGVVGYAIPAVTATAVVSRVAAPLLVAGGAGTAATVGKFAHRAMTSITTGLTTTAQAYGSSTYSTYQKLLDRAYDEGVELTPAKEKELWQTAGQSAVGGAAANGALTMAITALAGPIGRGMGVSGGTVLGKAGQLGSGTLDDTTLMTMLLSSSSRGAVIRQAKNLLRDKKVRGLFMDAIKNSDKKLIGGIKDWSKRQVFDKSMEGLEEGIAGGAQSLLDAIGEQKLGFENDGLFNAFTSSFAEEAVMGIAASVPMNSVMGNAAAAKAYFSDKNNISTAIGKVFARNKAFAAKLGGIKGDIDESTAYEALAGLKKNGELEAAKALEVIVKESKVSPSQPTPRGQQQTPPMPGTTSQPKKAEMFGDMQGSSGSVKLDIKKGDEDIDTLEEVDHPVYGIGRYSRIKSVGSENIIGKGVVYSQVKDKASLAAAPKVSEPNERGETTVTYQVAYRESSEGKGAKYKPTDKQVELILDKDGVVISSKIGALVSSTPQVKATVTQKNQSELHTMPQDSKAVEEGRLYKVLSKFTPLSRATVAQVSRGNGGRAFLGALRSIVGRTIPSTFNGKYMTEKPISVADARSQLDKLEEGLNEGAYEGLTPQEKNQLVRAINDVRERIDQFESDPLPFYGGDANSLLARTAMASIEAREAGQLNSSHVDEKAYKAIPPKPIPVKKPLPTPPPKKTQSDPDPESEPESDPEPEPESGTEGDPEPESESPNLATENNLKASFVLPGKMNNYPVASFEVIGKDGKKYVVEARFLPHNDGSVVWVVSTPGRSTNGEVTGGRPLGRTEAEYRAAAVRALGESLVLTIEEEFYKGAINESYTETASDNLKSIADNYDGSRESTTEGQPFSEPPSSEPETPSPETTEPIIGDLVTNPDGSQSMFLGEGVYVAIPNEQQAIGKVSDFTNAVKRAGLNLESVITSKVYEILDGLGDDGSFPVTVVVDNTIPSAAELAYPEGAATSGVIRINLEQMNQLRMTNPSLVAKGILHEIHHVATIRQYVRENGGAEIAIEKIAELGRQVKANDSASTMLREGYPTTTKLSDVNAGLEYLAVLHERVLTGDSVGDAYRSAGLLPGENMTIIERWLNAAKRMAEAMFGMKDIPGVSDMLKRIELSLRASEAYKAEQSALASRVQQSRVQLSNSLKEMVANVEEAANQADPPTPPEPVADSRTSTQPKKKDIIFTEIVEDNVNPPEELPPTQAPFFEKKKREAQLANEAVAEIEDAAILDRPKDMVAARPADISRMTKLLGVNMYGDKPAETVGKEVYQNAVDAVMAGYLAKGTKPQITTNYTEGDKKTPTFTIADNGLGMTPKKILEAFLPAFVSGKGVGEGGGFGIAKLAFLAGPKKVRVVSVSEVDGKKIITFLKIEEGGYYEYMERGPQNINVSPGAGVQQLADGMTMEVVETTEDIATGTGYVTEFNKDDKWDPWQAHKFINEASKYLPDVDVNEERLYGNVRPVIEASNVEELLENRQNKSDGSDAINITDLVGIQRIEQRIESKKAKELGVLHKVDTPNFELEIVAPNGSQLTKGRLLSILGFPILNRNILQFTSAVKINDEVFLPEGLAVNLRPKVSADSAGYPFTTDRKNVTSEVSLIIAEWANTQGQKAVDEVNAKWEARRDSAAKIKGTEYTYMDMGGTVDQQVVDKLIQDPLIKVVLDDVAKIHNAVLAMLERKYKNVSDPFNDSNEGWGRARFTGLMSGSGAYGVHFGKPGSEENSNIFNDPFLTYKKSEEEHKNINEQDALQGKPAPETFSEEWYKAAYEHFITKLSGIALHESLHQQIDSEGQELSRELTFKAGDIIDALSFVLDVEHSPAEAKSLAISLNDYYDKLYENANESDAKDFFTAEGAAGYLSAGQREGQGRRRTADEAGEAGGADGAGSGETSVARNTPTGLSPTQAPVFEEGEMSRGEAEGVLFALHKHAAIGGVTRYGDGILRLEDDEFVLSVAPEALPTDAGEQARMSFYGDVPPTINEVNQAINFLNDVGGTGLNFRQYLSAALPNAQAALENSTEPTTPEEEKSLKGLKDQIAAIKEAQEMISMLLGQSTKLEFDATPQGEWLASSEDFNDKYRNEANDITMHSENHVGAQMMHMWGDFDESGQHSLAAVSKDILRGSVRDGKPTTDVYIPLNRKAVGLLRQAVNYTNKENPWFMRIRKKKGEERVIKPSEVPLSDTVKSDLRREIGKARAIYESNNPSKSWESLYADQKFDRSIELIADKVVAGRDGRLYLKVPSLLQIYGTDESGRKAASSENSAILKTLAYQEAVSWHDQYQEGNFDRDSLYGSVLESQDFYTDIATRMGLDKPDRINTFDKLKKALGYKGIFPTSDTKIPFLDTSAAVRSLPSEFTEKYTRAVTEAMDEALPDNHPYKKWISQLKSEFGTIDKSRISGTDRVKAIDNTRFVANNLSSFSLQFARQMASVMWMNASGSHKMRGAVGRVIDLGLMAHFDKSHNATGRPSGFRVVRAKSTSDLVKSVGLVSETDWDNMLTDLNALNLIGVKQGLELQLSQGDTSVSQDIAEVDAKIEKVSRSVMKRLTSDERTDTGQSVVDRAYSIMSSGFDRFADKDNTALTKRTVLLAHIFDADTTAMRKFVTETINKKDSDLDAAIYEKLAQMVMSEIKVKNGMQDLAASILTDIQYKPMPVNEGAAKQDVMSVLGSHDLPFEYIHKFIDDAVDDNGNINQEKVGESLDGMLAGLREDYRKNREQLEQAEASIEDADSYQIARVRAQAELYRRALDRIERNANTLKEMLPTLQYSGVTLGSLDESQYRDFVTLILNNDSVNVFSSSNDWAAYSVNDALFSSFGTSEYESGGNTITSAPIHPVVSDFFAKHDNIPIITYNSSTDWRKVVGTKGSGLVIDADGEVAAIVHDMDNPYSWRSLGNQIIDYTLSRSLDSSDKAKEVLDTVRGVLHRSQMATLGDARITRDSRINIGTDQELMLTTDEINRAESINESYTTHVAGLERELFDLRRQKHALQNNGLLLGGENVSDYGLDQMGNPYSPDKDVLKGRDFEVAFKQEGFDKERADLKEKIASLEKDIEGVMVDLNKASITALKEQNIKPNDNPYFQLSSERKANMLGVSFADRKKVEALRADTIEAENARNLSLDKYFNGIERQIARLESDLASEDAQVNEENLFSLAAETAYEGDLGMVGQTRLVKHAKAKLNELKDQRSASKAMRISKYKHSYKMADWQISSKEIIQKIKNGKSVFSQITDIAQLAETLSANAGSSMDRARAAETAKKMSEINDALQIEVLVKQLEGYEQIVKVYDVGFKRRDKKVKDTKEIKGHRAKMLASKEKANSIDKKITSLKKDNKDTAELESNLSDQNKITEHHTEMGKILTSILQQHNPTKENPSPDMSKILISRNEAERMVDKLKARITRAVNVGKDTDLDGNSLRKLVGYTSNALIPLAEKMTRPVTQEVAYRVTPGSKTKRDITKVDNVLKRLGSSSFMRMSNHELLKAMITSPELIQLMSDLPEQDIVLMESAFRRSYVFKKGTKSHIEYMTSLFAAMEQTLLSNASKVDVTFDTVEAEIAAENEAREELDEGGVDSTPNTYARDSMVVLEETGYTDTQRIQSISGLLSAIFHSLNNPDAATDVTTANSEKWEVIQEKVRSRARGADDYDAALEQEIEDLQSVELYQKTHAGMESVSLMRYLQQSSGGKTYVAIPQALQDRLAIKKATQSINGAWDNVWGTPSYDEQLAGRLSYIKGLIAHPETERLGKALLLDEINKGGDKLKPYAQLETSDLAPYIVHKNAQIEAVKKDYVKLDEYTIDGSPVPRAQWVDYRIDQLEQKIGENTRTHAERLSKYKVASDMTLVHHMWSMDQASQYQTDKPLVLHAGSISEKSDVVTTPHILIAAGIHQRTRYVADKINNIKESLLALNNNVDPFTESLMKFSDQAVFDADAFADSAKYIIEQIQAIQGTHNTLPEGKTKSKIEYTTVLLDKLSEMFYDENGNVDGSDVRVKESLRLVTSIQEQLNTSTLDSTVDDVMKAMPDLGQKVDWRTETLKGDVLSNIESFFAKYRYALGATTSNATLDRFADSIKNLDDMSTEIKKDEAEIRRLETDKKKMETMRDNARFETDVLPSEGLDMIINHWLARTGAESRTDALGMERLQYKDLLPKNAGKISYVEQVEALKDATDLIQNIMEDSNEELPSPYERAVSHGGLGSIKSRSKGLGGLEPTRAVVLPSKMKKPVVLSPGQLPKESRLNTIEEIETFVGDTLAGEITSDYSYYLNGSEPLGNESRGFVRLVKKSMIANNEVFSDLAKSASQGNAHAKNVINQMEVMINDLVAITQDVNVSEDIKGHANFALKNFSEGDLRSAQKEYHVVLACVLAVPFMEAVRKGSNPNKAAATLFGEKRARYKHVDAKIFTKFSRDIEARKVMFHILQTVDDGIDGKSGRNAAIRESKIGDKPITVAASKLGTVKESYEATMVGQVLGYIDDDNLSPLEMLDKNLYIYESSKDTMLNAKGVIKGKSRYKKTIKKQIKVIEDLIPRIRKAASQIDPSLTKEQFFDELEVKLFEMLNEDQINFIQVSRQEFKDRYDSLAAVMAIQGRELGKIHNYLPITSYRRDDSDKSDFILNMQYTPDGSYGRSRYEGDEETAINLDGASTFAGTLASMSYSINTTTTYSSIGSLFGGVDADSQIKYESEEERPQPMVNKFLEINGQNNIYADDASVFVKKMVIDIYENDNPQNPEDGLLTDIMMKATEVGYKQGLLSYTQPIRQTVPVITSYTLRNMLLNPRKVVRFFGSAYKLLADKKYKNVIKEKIMAHAPSISFRALDGNDVINNSVIKSFRKMPLHKKTGWLVSLPIRAAWRLGDKIMNTLLGKPDQWLMHAMIATEYENYSGDSLADENARFDPTTFAYSRAVVEGTLAQSDKSKKAQILQSSGFISRAASAFSNHVLSTASTAHSGLSLIRNSTTAEGKREGLSMASDFIFQTLAFTALSTGNAIYFIAKAVGENEEEEEKIQKELLDKLSSPVSKDGLMASAFNMDAGEVEGMNQIIGEVERRPMDSQKFFHRFFWRSGVQSAGVVSPFLSLSLVNRILEGVSTAGLELATGKEFTHNKTIADQQTESFQLLGAAGVAATNAFKYVQTYATGDDWEDRDFDHRDVLYLASQILYNREQRYRLQRDIQKRDNVPVWDMSKKKGEPLINIDSLLDKL